MKIAQTYGEEVLQLMHIERGSIQLCNHFQKALLKIVKQLLMITNFFE